MRKAIKKKTLVKAYRLGENSETEQEMIRLGRICPLPDGRYELFSQEAVNGSGEIACRGDYFKLDQTDKGTFVYPNGRAFFEKKHRHVAGDLYEQIAEPVGIWQAEEGLCDEIRFLLETGRLIIEENDPRKYFSAELWGSRLSAARDAFVLFYQVDRAENGEIREISFNFVEKNYFEEHYDILP